MDMDSDKNQGDKPLVVDLDGTLLKTDMLFESANYLMVREPLRFASLLSRFTKSKSHLKMQLASTCQIDVSKLPYNSKLLAILEKQKALGRNIVLATASHRELAEAIANHLKIFDEVMATEGDVNLKSEAKRQLLVNRFGEKGFDYIGNSKADLPIWNSADKAYVVSSSQTLIERVRDIGNLADVIPNERAPLFQTLLRVARPHQWVKNLLLFIPPLAAHQLGNLNTLIEAFIGFFVFCLAASSVYILNDLIDVADDRYHHRKRHRPFASGNLSLLFGWILWPILAIVAFLIALYFLPSYFSMVLASYYVLTMAYSLRLKQLAILDVITLAVLYTLRIIAGAEVADTPLSFWLLAFSVFIFLSLAFIKRYSELKSARQAGRNTQIKGRGYVDEDLEIVSTMGIGAGYLAVLVLALYIQDDHTILLYPSPHFIWLACPLLLYWISRAWLIADRGQMHDDPIVFAIKDQVSWVIGACFIVAFTLAMVTV